MFLLILGVTNQNSPLILWKIPHDGLFAVNTIWPVLIFVYLDPNPGRYFGLTRPQLSLTQIFFVNLGDNLCSKSWKNSKKCPITQNFGPNPAPKWVLLRFENGLTQDTGKCCLPIPIPYWAVLKSDWFPSIFFQHQKCTDVSGGGPADPRDPLLGGGQGDIYRAVPVSQGLHRSLLRKVRSRLHPRSRQVGSGLYPSHFKTFWICRHLNLNFNAIFKSESGELEQST